MAAQDVVYGLRMMEVGVVKDINVSNALAGVVTTNINNFSGTDTKLGLITNEMYAACMGKTGCNECKLLPSILTLQQ